MQVLYHHGLRRASPSVACADLNFVRNASLTSAISRGIRKGGNTIDRLGTGHRSAERDEKPRLRRSAEVSGRSRFENDKRERPEAQRNALRRSRYETTTEPQERPYRSRSSPKTVFPSRSTRAESDVKSDIRHTTSPRSRFGAGTQDQRDKSRRGPNTIGRAGSDRRSAEVDEKSNFGYAKPPRSRYEMEKRGQSDKFRKQSWRKDEGKEPRHISREAPQGIPYTTAGSEFLYGTFAVKAALKAGRRGLHRLYVWKGEQNTNDEHDESIVKLARSKGIIVNEVAGTWDKMLLKMSGQRPHNGYVLETSPIPKLPIVRLEEMNAADDDLTVVVQPQSAEDQANNKIFDPQGSVSNIPRIGSKGRFPLLLWLDRVTDTGNLGAIMRTAYFFGVDAILIPEHGTAPFGPVTVKASAGTAEYLPILIVKKELEFVKSSQENGWKFFAAVAPDSSSTKQKSSIVHVDNATRVLDSSPCVLMVGNEGEGLRSFMQRAADEPISIEGGHKKSGIVDSLNVSVAAALLVARFFTQSSRTPARSQPIQEPSEHTTQSERNSMF